MCSDENGAPHAVRYLNAQLVVLHENARKCLEEHPQARTEDNSMTVHAAAVVFADVIIRTFLRLSGICRPEIWGNGPCVPGEVRQSRARIHL